MRPGAHHLGRLCMASRSASEGDLRAMSSISCSAAASSCNASRNLIMTPVQVSSAFDTCLSSALDLKSRCRDNGRRVKCSER